MPASRWPWWWARTLDAARHAAERAVIDIEPGEAILDIETALAKKAYVQAPQTLLRGDPDTAMKSAPHRLTAEFSVGGQEHFYLEGQVAFALPGEDGDIVVHSSTQHPTEVQHICARLLGCDFNQVDGGGAPPRRRLRRQGEQCVLGRGCRRAGGQRDRQAVKLRLPREVDMIATGKRHPFHYRY